MTSIVPETPARIPENREAVPLPDTPLDHRVPLAGGSWRVWRCVCVRSAGFPASAVLKLSDSTSAAAADAVRHAEAAAEAARAKAIAVIDAGLDDLRSSGRWDDKRERSSLLEARRLLKPGGGREPLLRLSGRHEGVADYCNLLAKGDATVRVFRQTFESRRASRGEAIRALASEKRFQEAVIWQNRHAFHTGIRPLLNTAAEGVEHPRKTRQREELIANYAQRYCVKNDTIGFFGPVGWAAFADDGPSIASRPAGRLLAARDVYFEPWCIEALAEFMGQDPNLRPWIPPRRLPFVHLDGPTVELPLVGPVTLSETQRVVLEACDGTRTAMEIAKDLVDRHPQRFAGVADVHRFLNILKTMGLISWGLIVPFQARPERALRRLVNGVGDESLRRGALEGLVALDAARCRVAQAAGDPESLDSALAEVDSIFTRITGSSSTRKAGVTYAGRTLLYEDCRRNLDVTFGPGLLDSLGPPLSLLLTSARWFTFEIARGYRALFKEVYDGLVRGSGSSTVEAVRLLPRLYPLILEGESDLIDRIESTFRDKWSRVLNLPSGQRRVAYSSEALRSGVMEEFDVPRPGWRGAFYHSPDVMIAASSEEAIRRGQYELVLGELHLSVNTLRALLFVQQHPSPRALERAIELDMPDAGIQLVPPNDWMGGAKRTWQVLASPRDLHLEVGTGASPAPPARTLQLGMFVVAERDGSLEMRSRDGRLRFDLMDVLADSFVKASYNRFRILRSPGHLPRVSIDRLVVSRESSRVAASTLGFAGHATEADRFLAARRWAADHGLPRCVFVKAPVEVKPFFVDFDSPVSIEVLAKVVRRTVEDGPDAHEVVFSEMLPAMDQLWLQDAAGERYTSELRIVAVDQAL